MAVHDLIERIQVLSIDPDDVLVVKVADDHRLTEQERRDTVDALRLAMPRNRIILCQGVDLELQVIREQIRQGGP